MCGRICFSYKKRISGKNKQRRFPKEIDKDKRKTEEDELENSLARWMSKQSANLDKNNTLQFSSLESHQIKLLG